MTGSWEEIVEALEAGEVDGADGGPFRRYETHGSVVLVSARVAYKLKKPVTFEFLDYGSVQQRGEMCRTEVALNRRLAPGVYLGALPIVASDDGYRLGAEGEAPAAEWVVAMRPIGPEQMLDQRVDSHRATAPDLERVGRLLAAFHLAADPADARRAAPEALAERLEGHVRVLREAGAGIVEEGRLEEVRRFAQGWLDRHAGKLVERVEAGWVRDGHGDLRLEHVVLGEEGVEVIDCVEFDPGLRAGDVLFDLSFLVMELELAGRDDLAAALIGAWTDAGGPFDERALWLFATLKALVRVEVAVHRAVQLDSGYRQFVVTDLARTHLALAQRLVWRAHGPAVLVIAGLSGSGKTVVSTRLSERWGLERVASDETRKRLVGVARDELAPGHAYDDYVSEVVYEQLGRAAAASLVAGRSIVVDATFRRERDRQRFLDALGGQEGEGSPPLIAVELTAPSAVLERRVEQRSERGGSDADVSVLREQLAEIDGADRPLLPGGVVLDAERPVESIVADVERAALDRMAGAEPNIDAP